jgi:ABC-type multidrug transport system fused ATPase/permease subunit
LITLKTQSKTLKDILNFIGRRAAVWSLLGICGTFLLAAVELGIAYFIPIFLNAVGLVDSSMASAPFQLDYKLPIWAVGAALIGLGVLRFLGQYCVNQSGIAAQEGVTARLRKVLIYRILLHPNQSFMSASQSNYYLGTIFAGASLTVNLVTMSAAQALQAVSLVFVMIAITWKEALIGVTGLFLLGLLIRRINKAIRARSARVPLENKSLIAGFERVARNWLLVKVLKTQRHEHDHFSKSINSVFQHSLVAASLSNLASAGTPLIGIFLLTFIVFVSTNFWATPGSVLISFLYVFIRFVQGLSATVSTVTQANRYVPQFSEAANFFFSFSPKEITDALTEGATHNSGSSSSNSPDRKPGKPPQISFQSVSFSYRDNDIFDNVSFHVESGKTIGIVGPSGSGKSTLLLLMLGALEPTSGTVHLDNTSASRIMLNSDFEIGYVGPEPFLFEGTIRDNLAYGMRDISDGELWAALSEAHLVDAIKNMPNQLEHGISENGEGLSAGQKQRLCLARIFLRKPSLIILDEATANLDVKTEEDVINSLAEMKSKATIVIVTHRLTTLKHADYVFDMEKREMAIAYLHEKFNSGSRPMLAEEALNGSMKM